MNLNLTDDETAALLRELDGIIDAATLTATFLEVEDIFESRAIELGYRVRS